MQLEQIAVNLRPRTGWEAIDLGYTMTQAWWKTIAGAWCAIYLPAALLINLACWAQPAYAVAILWWLKPAFDRVVLHVLGGATFGSKPTVGETLRALPRLWWKNGLFAALTYARFSPVRSFHLPVTQLEGSRGKQARVRRRVLGREGRGPAVWLTTICVHLEVVVFFSVCLVINMLWPGDTVFELSWQALFSPQASKGMQYLSNAISAMTISILEPFYVAAGFAIYLNCRTALEGWDVELAFKRLSARVEQLKTAGARVGSIAASLVLGVALLFAEAPPAQAQSCPVQTADDTDGPDEPIEPEAAPAVKPFTPDTGAGKAIDRVLANPEFGEKKTEWKVRYVGPNWWDAKPSKETDWAWLLKVVEFMAKGMRVLVWIAGGVLVLGLLYLLARYVNLNRVGRGGGGLPDVLFGLDVRPESLPADIAAAIDAMLKSGDLRGAVGLLYRAALVSLLQDGRIDIRRGDTEGECERMVRAAYGGEEAKSAYFGRLIALWQQLAYAHRPAAVADIEALAADWPKYFHVAPVDRAEPGEAAWQGAT